MDGKCVVGEMVANDGSNIICNIFDCISSES